MRRWAITLNCMCTYSERSVPSAMQYGRVPSHYGVGHNEHVDQQAKQPLEIPTWANSSPCRLRKSQRICEKEHSYVHDTVQIPESLMDQVSKIRAKASLAHFYTAHAPKLHFVWSYLDGRPIATEKQTTCS